ncbi:hypothetical protein ACJVC5_10755 [Peredibacter sp. HCB2-198]|uniref:hypothetical protein n=1 Tax=Peredibacter sp. HCB2-198 TaxID=3383025 RepID=UPI0038B683AC
MANNNNAFSGDEVSQGADLPQQSTSQVREYGKKSLAPFVDLIHQYRNDIGPYLSALGKGLQAACDSFQESEQMPEADRVVSGWFTELNRWFVGAREKINSGDEKDFLRFLEEEAREHPAAMFSSSYIAGMLFGRMGRHMVRMKKNQLH